MDTIDLILVIVGVLCLFFFIPWLFRKGSKILRYLSFLGDKYSRGGHKYD